MRLFIGILAMLPASIAVAAQVATDPNLFASRDPNRDADIYTWAVSSAEISLNRPYLGFFVERDASRRPQAPTMVISAKTAKGLRPECRNAVWTVDGAVIKPQEQANHIAKLPQAGVLENLNSVFTVHDLRTVAAAESVKYKLCESEYAMTEKEQEGLRGVLGLFDGRLVIKEHPAHD
jgi:hypothetical protein